MFKPTRRVRRFVKRRFRRKGKGKGKGRRFGKGFGKRMHGKGLGIYLCNMSDYDYEHKNIRVHVTRACTRLTIVYCFDRSSYRFTDFRTAKLDPTFMSECENDVEIDIELL